MNESQYHRCVFLIEQLKKGKSLTVKSLVLALKKEQDYNDRIPAVSARTVQRDIALLRDSHNAPISGETEYVLTDPNWSFQLKLPFGRKEFALHTMLGLQTLSELMPGSFKDKIVSSSIRTARAQIPMDVVSPMLLEQFIIASGVKVEISADVFKTLFYAWCNCQTVKIRYNDPKGSKTTREIEPQVIAYRHGVWYVKGYKITRSSKEEKPQREIRVLAVHRILSVERLPHIFERDMVLLEETAVNGLFTYPKLDGVKVRCDASIAFYLKEHQKLKKFKVKALEGGDIEVTFDGAIEHELIRWILGEAGHVEVLEPRSLREKVSKTALCTAERNRI